MSALLLSGHTFCSVDFKGTRAYVPVVLPEVYDIKQMNPQIVYVPMRVFLDNVIMCRIRSFTTSK